MILLSSVFYIIREELSLEVHGSCSKQVMTGFWIANVSLAVFFLALLMAGFGRGLYDGAAFQEMMTQIRPFLIVFVVSGVSLMIGLWIVLWNAFRLMGYIVAPQSSEEAQPEPA